MALVQRGKVLCGVLADGCEELRDWKICVKVCLLSSAWEFQLLSSKLEFTVQKGLPMTSLRSIASAGLATAGLMAFLMTSAAVAQPNGELGPDTMMGPGMMGWRSMGRDICDPRGAGLAEWRIARLERAIKPTEAQRPALDELRAASKKAAEAISAACPRELSQSPVARLEAMERRLEAMLQAVKTVRPAFDSFYASLTDEQKARLAEAGPRQWGWRGWHWPWSQRG